MKLIEWAKTQGWWGVAKALLDQPNMGTLMHVPSGGMPKGKNRIWNKTTGSWIVFTGCDKAGGMHIIVSTNAQVLEGALERVMEEAGPHDHGLPALPIQRGFRPPVAGDA